MLEKIIDTPDAGANYASLISKDAIETFWTKRGMEEELLEDLNVTGSLWSYPILSDSCNGSLLPEHHEEAVADWMTQ